jgi:hypothetical protein
MISNIISEAVAGVIVLAFLVILVGRDDPVEKSRDRHRSVELGKRFGGYRASRNSIELKGETHQYEEQLHDRGGRGLQWRIITAPRT